MVRMFVRHKVNDYAAWRKAYDDFEATRASLGASGHGIFRAADDPNDVTAWHDFDSSPARPISGSRTRRSARRS